MYTLTWTWSETNWFYLQCLLAITVTHWSYSETLAAQTTWWSTTHPSCLMHDWTKRNVFFLYLDFRWLTSWAANSKWHQFIIMGDHKLARVKGPTIQWTLCHSLGVFCNVNNSRTLTFHTHFSYILMEQVRDFNIFKTYSWTIGPGCFQRCI